MKKFVKYEEYTTRFSGGFSTGILMLRRYLFEIILSTLIFCGVIAIFFYF